MKTWILLLCCLLAGLLATAQGTAFSNADTTSAGTTKTGNITGAAAQHYYKAALPGAGIFRLITTTSNTGGAFGIVQYRIFWKTRTTVTSFNVNRNPSVSGTDTFIAGCLQADSIYILADNIWAGQPMSFSIRFDVLGQLPNNEAAANETIATAELLPIHTKRDAHISFATPSGTDVTDYYKIIFPGNGTLRMFAGATMLYAGGSAPAPTVYVLDKNGNQTSLFRAVSTSGAGSQQIGGLYGPAFSTVKDTLSVYGRAADTMYVMIQSYHAGLGTGWCAAYDLQWTITDTAANNEPEPNATMAQAPLLAEGATIDGDISYTNTAGADLDDYYRIVPAKDATITLYVSSTNTYNRQNNPATAFYLLDKTGTSLLLQNNTGAQGAPLRARNNGSLPFLSSISDTMHVFGRASDTFYVRVYNYHSGQGTAYAGHYTLRYQLDDTSAHNEQEPNHTMATAQPITQADTINGHVNYADGRSNTDIYDYYRVAKPAGGSIVLYITGRNTWGYRSGYAGAPVVNAYTKTGAPLSIRSATGASGGSMRVRNNSTLAYGSGVTDTMVISCINSDTAYIAISNYINFQYGGVASNYRLRYEYIPGPKSDFNYSRVGNEFGFVNSSKFADSYLWIMGNGNTYTSYHPPVVTYGPNAYTVQLVTYQGACAYRDTARQSFTIAGVERFTPGSAGRGGDVALQIFGGGLEATTTVVLKQGTTTLTPVKQYTNTRKNHLTAILDLHNVPAGLYDVTITVLGQAPVTYTNGFRVDSFKYPYSWSTVSGPSRWLANRPARFNLTVGNNGNVMASGVVVAMLWPKSANLTWLKEDYKPSFAGTDTFAVPAYGKTYTVPRAGYRYIYDSVEMFTAVDSFEGRPYDGYIKFFQIPFIPANSTVSIPFDVTASAPALQRFITYTHRPNIFGSCPNGNQEDLMNNLSGEFIDAVDGFADKTKVPLFKAFTKTAKVGQYHMRSLATYAGEEFWAWYDGYETDHNANEAAWIGRTEECNEAATQTFLSEAGNAGLTAAVSKAKVLNDRIRFVNKMLANNPKLSPKTYEKAMGIIERSSKSLGSINYDRLKLLKDLYDKTKDMASQSEKIAKLLEYINNCPELKDQQKELLDMLGGELDHNGGSDFNTSTVNSMDPNDIYGPAGVGANAYLNSTQRQSFLITFENIATATADAQSVVVLDTIDKTKFDIGTISLGDIVVGGQLFRLPQNRNEAMVYGRLNTIPGIQLRIIVTTDTARGIIKWQFTAIDSATNNRPVLAGFLPPNVNGRQGTGSVSYTINPAAAVTDGATLRSRASIIFDGNAPIATQTWMNTVDLLPPASRVTGATLIRDTTILLRFSGSDATSGVQEYRVYYSTNNGPWHFLGTSEADSMTVLGQQDSAYRFYSVASDRVENRESKSPVAEASIHVPLTVGAAHAGSVLMSIAPNPAASTTTIRFRLMEAQMVQVELYDVTGRTVAVLYAQSTLGMVSIQPDLSHLAAGMYTVRLRGSKGASGTGKLVIAR